MSARSTRWNLVDDVDQARSGEDQMAADVALLEAAARDGTRTLRLYTWAHPTLSLGRFQPDDDVDADACARLGVPVVRRPSGGAGLMHGSDLTYAVAMPRPLGRDAGVNASYALLARGLIAGLAQLGITAQVARHGGPAGPVCFSGQQGADLRVGERKICGSAQTRRDGALLQHGSILLHRLDIDETDVMHTTRDRHALRRATVTLQELGAPHDAPTVAAAVVEGFHRALDAEFDAAPTSETRGIPAHH